MAPKVETRLTNHPNTKRKNRLVVPFADSDKKHAPFELEDETFKNTRPQKRVHRMRET
jgi:hypothetical protein